MLAPQQVVQFVQAALECSIYIAPKDPGLTYDEIIEVGKRVGFQPGEIGDALQQIATQQVTVLRGRNRFCPDRSTVTMMGIFALREEPDYRNFAALDFVCSELNARIRADGARNARLERNVVVERAVAQGIPRNDIEAAITIFVMCQQLIEKDGVLRRNGGQYQPLPSEQQAQAVGQTLSKAARAQAHPIVKDVIERRSDNRPKHVEPLDAFADELDNLGYGHFRLWWNQTVAEFRHGSTQSTPVSVCVLAAALVEGALTFVVTHARKLGLRTLASKTFEGDPRSWHIDDLVRSAAAGGDSAILDASAQRRADGLIRIRQRIHAGRMLSDYPGGPPDLLPEEAREGRETADVVVRRVLNWLQKYPPGNNPP